MGLPWIGVDSILGFCEAYFKTCIFNTAFQAFISSTYAESRPMLPHTQSLEYYDIPHYSFLIFTDPLCTQ